MTSASEFTVTSTLAEWLCAQTNVNLPRGSAREGARCRLRCDRQHGGVLVELAVVK